jgi:hypothetical protein
MDALNRFEESGHADHVSLQPQPLPAEPEAVVASEPDGGADAVPVMVERTPVAESDAAAVAAVPDGPGPATAPEFPALAAVADVPAVAVLERPVASEPVPVAMAGVVPATADDADVLPWSLAALLASTQAVGRLFLADGSTVGLPADTAGLARVRVTVEDGRGAGTVAEGDGSLRDIMTFRNDVVVPLGAAPSPAGTLVLAALPEDGETLRRLVQACGVERLELRSPASEVPGGVTADWLHRLKGLLDEGDLFQAAWRRLGSPPALVRWGLRLLADVGEVVEEFGVTRRGRVRGGSLLFKLPHYDGYRRWADQRRAYWQMMTAGSAADIEQWLEGTTDGD